MSPRALLEGGPVDGQEVEAPERGDVVLVPDRDDPAKDNLYRYKGSMVPAGDGVGIPIFEYEGHR